jgi:predicted nucleic acid-binding protein
MDFLNEKLRALPDGNCCISVITRMEILADPKQTEITLRKAEDFLQDVSVIPLTDAIERIATGIRRSGLPRPRLPDAIVAATAVALEAPLITRDADFLRLQWHGLHTAGMS